MTKKNKDNNEPEPLGSVLWLSVIAFLLILAAIILHVLKMDIWPSD